MSDPIQFGRYRLVSLLGEGGMARVYKAVLAGQMGFEKTVALKRIPRSVTSDERMLKALINEARLGGRLVHKNIVETYEFDDIGGHYYLAMEMVEGRSLHQFVRESEVPDTERDEASTVPTIRFDEEVKAGDAGALQRLKKRPSRPTRPCIDQDLLPCWALD